MDAWVRAACYPRRTFYPLSDDPSIRDHRITMTDFRLCLVRRPCSQAGFCHCTQHPISDRIEPNQRPLPFLFGRRPPQSNCLPYTVSDPVSGTRLDIRNKKGGISRTAPPRLAPRLQCLPPILHIPFLIPL